MNQTALLAGIKLPDDIGFRHVRVLCVNGRWVSARRKICNDLEMKKFLDDLPSPPFKVYVSVNNWLQPGALRGRVLTKAGYLVDSQVLLKQRLLFDFDPGSFSQERVRSDALKIISWMERYHKNYELDFIQASSKGLHLVYVDPYKIKEGDVFKRQDSFKRRRLRLLRFLPELKTLDITGVSSDVRRIFKLDGFYSLDTGLKVSRISLDTLKKHTMKSIIKGLDHAPVNLAIGNDKPLRGDTETMKAGELALNDGTGVTSPATFFQFVKNTVWGTRNLFVLMLFYDVVYFDSRRVSRLQEAYDLGPLVSFKSDSLVTVVGVKPLQYRRLLKVMRAGRSRFVSSFLKFGQSRFFFSDLVDVNDVVLKPAPVFDTLFPAILPRVLSRPHCLFLRKYLNLEGFNGKMIGANDYKVGIMAGDA